MIDDFTEHLSNAQRNGTDALEGISKLTELHIGLVVEEIKQQGQLFARSAVLLVGEMIALLCATLVGSYAAVLLLKESNLDLTLNQSLLIVFGVWLLIAIIIGSAAIRAMTRLSLVPHAAIDSLRESMKCITTTN